MTNHARGSVDPSGHPPISDADRCTYIAEMCQELRDLAPRSRLRDLNYLLDLARAEADFMAKRLRGGTLPLRQ